MASMKLILASSSPRRIEILQDMHIDFEAHTPHFIEQSNPALSPEAEAQLFAREKALSLQAEFPDAWILGCDTLVALENEKLGKPRDAEDASQMLHKLSGRKHRVISALALLDGKTGELSEVIDIAEVSFRNISVEEIRAYVESGEPMDKAGAYAIQGGARNFVEKVEGDYFTIVGLPKEVLRRIFQKAGLIFSS